MNSPAPADIPGLFFGSPPVAVPAGERRICLPPGLRSKHKLLGVLADRLQFPRYFGDNWDALEECLHDLSWLPAGVEQVLVHPDLPFGLGENRAIYLRILAGAVRPGRLTAWFPAECQSAVREAVR